MALFACATWALFVGAAIAAYAALRQLRILRDDSARQTRQLERQQADKIDYTWCPASSVQILARPIGSVETAGRSVVIVSNNSPRPIRDVTSWIELADGTIITPGMLGRDCRA